MKTCGQDPFKLGGLGGGSHCVVLDHLDLIVRVNVDSSRWQARDEGSRIWRLAAH